MPYQRPAELNSYKCVLDAMLVDDLFQQSGMTQDYPHGTDQLIEGAVRYVIQQLRAKNIRGTDLYDP